MKKKDIFDALGFEVNPDGTLSPMDIEPTKYDCPQCGGHNAFYKEFHPDTGMDEILLYCPDCGYTGGEDTKMKKQLKTLAFEIKEVNDEDRSFLAVASTEDLDRDNDRIIAAGWDLDNFSKNPVIPWAHKYGDPPVAKSVETTVKDGKLLIKPKFASYDEYPFADTIYKLYKGGFLSAFSVGFKPRKYEIVERSKGVRGYDFLECELWEVSACTVPSNPNALIAAKAKGIISDAEMEMFENQKPEVRSQKAESGDQRSEERLNNVEESLKTISSMLEDIQVKINRPETHSNQESEVGSQESEEKIETPSLSDKQVADAIKSGIESAAKLLADKISKTVKAQVNYHLGIVD